MKVAAVFFLLLVGFSAQDEAEERIKRIRKHRSECIEQTKVEPELIDRADNGDFVDDAKLKCFSKCFYQKAGFVAENGDLLLEVIKAKIPPEEDRERALAILDKCKELKGADSCDTVFQVHKCYFQSAHQQKKP